MHYNTIIFDFDGTIADTNALILSSWQHTYRVLTGKEQDEGLLKATFGEPLATSMEKAFPEIPVDKALEIYRKHQFQIYEEMIRPFDGMKELVIQLRKEGYKTGLLTSRLRPSTMMGLEKFGMTACFDGIFTHEDCPIHKPNPEPMYVALRKLEAEPEKSLMIGDTLFDIRCAHNAGVEAALVGWSVALPEPAEEGEDKPEYVLNTAEELLSIVRK